MDIQTFSQFGFAGLMFGALCVGVAGMFAFFRQLVNNFIITIEKKDDVIQKNQEKLEDIIEKKNDSERALAISLAQFTEKIEELVDKNNK